MNISSDLSPEMKHHISELKRNHSYKGTVYSKKDLPKEASCNSFIQPVRDAPSKIQVSNNEVQNDSCSSWDAGIDICTEGMVLKKGWLMRRPTLFSKDEWSRHWFVLKNASFTYYRDPSAEDCGILDGVLDLNQVTSVECLKTEKYCAFSLIMWDNKKHVLSTVSSTARSSWIKAIQCASNLWDAESRRDFSNDEIVLPEHNFNSTEVPEHNFTEQTQDMSSSDDQSEYFSIIDDGEDEVGAGERSSSPRTLPPSPPLSRTPMSLVKERSRGRSNSYSCSSVATTNDDSAIEQEVSENHVDQTDSCQDISAKLMDRNFEESSNRKQDFVEKVNQENQSLIKQNSHEHFKTYESEESEGKIFDGDDFEKLSQKYQNLSETELLNLLSRDEVTISPEDVVDNDDYKVKYEYLKAKYVQEQMDWENKMKKEKATSLKGNSLSSYMKILQKTKRSVNELKEKFCGSAPNNQSMYIVAAKSLQQLCKELERISPYSEKRLKREGELKKWKKGFEELQHLCKNLQKSLQEEQNHNSILVLELKKKERTIAELEQEIHSFKKEQLFSSQRYQDDCSSRSSDTPDDITSVCKKLANKLKIADEQVRRIKKDLKDSHRNLDDLEIYCFQLKQDVKLSEENHQSQMALMTARVDDLTSKLTTSERNLRQIKQKLTKLESKQERRRSSLKNKEVISLSKEYETKLCDLEHKLTSIENELRFEDKPFTKEEEVVVPDNSGCERTLNKSLSQDSNCSGGGENMLLRLHNLSLRTRAIDEAVKKQAHLNGNESGDVFDKPKICLQVKSEEEAIEHEEEEECGEDWSTLSYATSLTDLQTFDGLDSCEFPNSWPEINECLDEKLESLLSWLKFSIHGLLKQEAVDAQNGANADFAILSSNILEAADSLSDTRTENASQVKFQPTKVCYKMLLLNEVTKAMQKIVNFESCLVLEKLCVCQPCFKFMLTHVKYLCSTENQSSTDMLNCFSLIEKSFLVSCSTYDTFLSDCLEDFVHVSQQSPNRLLLLQQNCAHLIKLLDDVKSRQFSVIMQTLADIPVQDPDVTSESSSLQNEDIFELDPLLLNIITVVSQFYKIAEYQLCELHQQRLSLLQCDHKVWSEWTTVLHNSLKAELHSVIEEIKDSYPQVREKNIFPCSLSSASYKKIICGSAILTRISLLKVLTNTILNFLSDENTVLCDNTDLKEWVVRLRDDYLSKASSLCEAKTIHFKSDFFENLCLDHILENGVREIKIESIFHDMHKKKIELQHKELDILIGENAKLKLACEEKDAQLHDLRNKLEQLVTKESCEECHSLKAKLKCMKQSHEAELTTVDKKYKEKMEEIHKHLQLVLEQKDDIHSQEVQRLEAQLQASQKISSRLELEYNQQVQHLKELYQHKMCIAEDPINEESVRKRYQTEIEQLKDLWEKGLAAVQNSYQQMTMELDMRHKQELSMLEAEKEKVLKEETQATIAALEVIRKYHAEELQREVAQYKKEILDRLQANNQMEISYDRRMNELDDVKHEIMLLSERYSVKCLENASLEEKVQSLQRQMNEVNHQLFDLTARNKQLMVHLAIDIEEIKQCLDANDSSDESLENLKILLKLKESEITEQKEANAQSKQELHLAQMLMSQPSDTQKLEEEANCGIQDKTSCAEHPASPLPLINN